MDLSELINTLKKYFKINDEQKIVNQFLIYKQYLQTQNQIMNLTRLDKDELIYEKYFYESLIPFFGFELNHLHLLDIGSGSGIPGIILKIIFPDLKLTILESNQKKINFMKSLCDKLGFVDVIFWCQRAEEINPNQFEKFDVVTSRAVSNLATLLEISCQYCKIGGLIIEPKSINYMNEYNKIKDKVSDYGLELEQLVEFNDKNYIFIFKKYTKPNAKYPRPWKDIIKEYK